MSFFSFSFYKIGEWGQNWLYWGGGGVWYQWEMGDGGERIAGG
jgi:hypothetical protein